MIRTIAILKKVKSVGDRIYPVLPYSKPCLRIRLNSPQIREEYNRFMKNKDSSWAQKKSISTNTNPVKSQNVKRSWALENVFKTSDTHRISHYPDKQQMKKERSTSSLIHQSYTEIVFVFTCIFIPFVHSL